MTLFNTILDKLKKHTDIRFIDVRYLSKWIRLYPECFPSYVISGNYDIRFNSNKLRHEIIKS